MLVDEDWKEGSLQEESARKTKTSGWAGAPNSEVITRSQLWTR